MQKFLPLAAIFVFLSAIALGQKIEKPTLIPKPATDEQTALIRQGIALHDKKDFDGAIAKYKAVLIENPDCTPALYELSISYFLKGDKTNAIETAVKGSKYRSDELPLFYGTIASVIDDIGKPEEAVKIFRDAIKIIKDDKDFVKHLASLYFNLGVTYTRQKKYVEARTELKRAVELDYAYASPHFVLSQVFFSSKYKIPAILASARFVTLEYNTQRTARSATLIAGSIDGAQKDPKTGNIVVNLDFFAPTDEGEFGMYDLMLGTLMVIDDEKGGNKNKSKGERFADAVDSLIGMLSEDKKLKSTFVGKQYIPFLDSMKKAGHTTAFSYLVLRQAGGNAEADKWTELNADKIVALINWSKAYSPQAK
jgi:tetratricopeptide (TPR) repeat protein